MSVNEGQVSIEEVTSIIEAVPGISIYQAIQDAQLEGYNSIEVDRLTNSAIVRWFKKEN